MSIKQLAVFVENHPGTLAEITDLLAQANVDTRALSISEIYSASTKSGI